MMQEAPEWKNEESREEQCLSDSMVSQLVCQRQ